MSGFTVRVHCQTSRTLVLDVCPSCFAYWSFCLISQLPWASSHTHKYLHTHKHPPSPGRPIVSPEPPSCPSVLCLEVWKSLMSSVRFTFPSPHMCVCVWGRDNERTGRTIQLPFPHLIAPALPKICHLLYPRIHCSKQRALIHPDSLPLPPSLLPLLSNLSQTYQQSSSSSSLQSKNRKKNKGKQESHLLGVNRCCQLWFFTHPLMKAGRMWEKLLLHKASCHSNTLFDTDLNWNDTVHSQNLGKLS